MLDQFGTSIGLQPGDADDLLFLFGIYVVAVGFLLGAYVLAGYVWVERHSVHYTTPKGEQRMSGFWGEFVLFTACAAVVVVALIFTRTDLTDLVSHHVGFILLGLVAVFAIYAVYARSVVVDARKDGKDAAYVTHLRNAYASYTVYAVLFFFCGALVIALLTLEFIADRAIFDTQAQIIMHTMAQAQAAAVDPAREAASRVNASLAYIEDANGGIAMATNLLQDQMNPTFLFAACVFFVNILIVATPIKHAFLNNATTITHVTTGIAIAGIILSGMLIYFGSYSVLIEHALAALKTMKPDPSLGEWEATQRYNQIVVELNARRNLLGFASAMGGEGSGLALFAAGIQFAVDRITKPEKE
ncbi:MAG: hypothetical protein ABUL73_03125 [Alphaproteobacteria bacterium]